MTTGGFEAAEWTTHTSGNWSEVTSEGTWSAISSYVNGGSSNSGSNKFGMNATGDQLISPAYTDPCDLSFYVRTSSDPDNWVLEVQTSTSAGGPWTTQSTVTENGAGGAITNIYALINIAINLTGTYYVRFNVLSRSAGSIYLDDISLTCGCSLNTVTTGAISGSPFSVDCTASSTDAGSVAFTSTGTFNAGNIYTAQLSDETGSFLNPLAIGTLTSTSNSGSINFTLPSTLITGSGYLIRIIASAPVVQGTNSSSFTIIQDTPCLPTLPGSGLIINEWSNGASGNQEYYEFVVAGQCGDLIDIRGYILDDNNATFTNPVDYSGTASGIAPGHFRFANAAQWASIPVGSLIVVYNANDPNPSLPADDPTDSDNDSLYVVPHNSTLFERCTVYPASSSPDSVYTGCAYAVAPIGGWNPLSLRNSGDAIQVRNPDGSYYHGVSYGGSEMTGGPDNLKLFSGSGSGMCGWFSDNDFFDIVNWSTGSTVGNQTPGLPNNAANLVWLLAMRDVTGLTCPIVVLPVELSKFEGIKTEDGNILYWQTESETNSAYFTLERSTDGKTWETIDIETSAGNSNSALTYSFTDTHFRNQVNYYRLSQTDIDGSTNVYQKFVYIDNTLLANSRLVKIVNVLGQEIDKNEHGMQIHIYNDGTSLKLYKH
jgi:hypothetical protein